MAKKVAKNLTSFSQNDLRYWLARVYRPRYGKAKDAEGDGEQDDDANDDRKEAGNGVTMILNPFGFPGATHCLERTGHELGIIWYRDCDSGKVGGLGHDLLRYWFPPPPKLWVQLDASTPSLCGGGAPSVAE